MLDTPAPELASHKGRTVFDGPAWVGGQWQHTQCSEFPDEYRVRVGEGPIFSVGRPHGDIACLGKASQLAAETLQGPVGILAAALRGSFCLHSSASLFPQGGIAFVGASGRGKSTLATLLSASGRPRLADDILKLHLDGDQVLSCEPRQPLAGIYLLGAEAEGVSSVRLHGTAAFRSVVEHSVGARLFGADLLAAHFDFCAALCTRVPVYRLEYPRRIDVAPAVDSTVNADARRLSGGG